ncbi:hypothetical protein JOF42_003267 [Microbacterium phyllosphaerae]|uniref:Uncharacterized protein n=1 Tax=Microbacterium phyllosphaerae TaxID=124798 RepID=A0ABS4WU78_9MICO|nr:hypothetical protein [Microbacterium phyllosphaerae]MBP2379772.1 hypothetical protein [Microbacterium phyllosphaerae]
MAVDEDTAPTSLKTHRYLRLSLVFIVVTLLLSVVIQTIVTSWEPFALGWTPLPSISHYFYTPARTVFVGALIAASLALLALSGRDRATTLLDISALFAPLIAIVPTGLANHQRVGPFECPDIFECVPVEFQGDMRLGIAVYAVVVMALVITMAVIRLRTRTPNPSARLVSIIALITAAAVAALAFAPALNEYFPFNFWPVHSIHFVVTLLFLGVFAAVPILYAGGPLDPGETPPTPRQRSIYRWIAGLLIVDLLLLVAALAFRQVFGETPVVLFGEAVALILFAAFWWVQTFQRWDDPNPPSIVVRRA